MATKIISQYVNLAGKRQARRTETKTFVSRCTTEEVGEDKVVLMSEAENRNALKHSEDVLQDEG